MININLPDFQRSLCWWRIAMKLAGPDVAGTVDDVVSYAHKNWTIPTANRSFFPRGSRANWPASFPKIGRTRGPMGAWARPTISSPRANIAANWPFLKARRSRRLLRQKYDAVNSAGGQTAFNFVTSGGDVTMDWIDLGPDLLGSAPIDADKPDLGPIPGDPNSLYAGELGRWAQEALNLVVSQSGQFAVANVFDSTAGISLAQKLANLVAHEVGHTFGLQEAYALVNGVFTNVDPIPDVMNLGLEDGVGHSSSHHRHDLDAAMGIAPSGGDDLAAAVEIYQENFNLPNSRNGLIHEVPGDPNASILAVLRNGATVLPGERADFGSTGIGQTITQQFTIENPSESDVSITEITLAAGNQGFSFQGAGAGTVIPAGGIVTLTVSFDPSIVGAANDSLFITSDNKLNFDLRLTRRGQRFLRVGGTAGGQRQ